MSLDEPKFDGKVISRKSGIEVGSLDPDQSVGKTLFVKCLQPGDRVVFARVGVYILETGWCLPG